MTYTLFVLAIALFGYIIYAVYFADAHPVHRDAPQPEPMATESQTAPLKVFANPAQKPAPAVPEKPAAVATESQPRRYRDPISGDVTTMPTNYRFAKRWIREAMVAEGLLDRVYTNAELDDDIIEQTRVALAELKKIEKYHVPNA